MHTVALQFARASIETKMTVYFPITAKHIFGTIHEGDINPLSPASEWTLSENDGKTGHNQMKMISRSKPVVPVGVKSISKISPNQDWLITLYSESWLTIVYKINRTQVLGNVPLPLAIGREIVGRVVSTGSEAEERRQGGRHHPDQGFPKRNICKHHAESCCSHEVSECECFLYFTLEGLWLIT